MKYMIHACKKRLWYVTDYLIPSMIRQGIPASQIGIWNDEEGKGNLASFLESMAWVRDRQDQTQSIWHLQDDVIISKDFGQVTGKDYTGIVCGFASEYDNDLTGEKRGSLMWFSQCCILIPNRMTGLFLDWYEENKALHADLSKDGKNDDALFKAFVVDRFPDVKATLLNPNIVDHVDYLIGGSVINVSRNKKVRSRYWNDEDVVNDLEIKLRGKT